MHGSSGIHLRQGRPRTLSYDVVKGLIQAAKDNHIDYAADVYPYYGSDADAALSAGIDANTDSSAQVSTLPTATSVPTRMQLPQRWNC